MSYERLLRSSEIWNLKSEISILLLGATGSIGENTLRVVRGHRDRLRIEGLAARSRWRDLTGPAREFGVKHIALGDPAAAREAENSGEFAAGTKFYAGENGLCEFAGLPGADTLVSAAVGTAGLLPTLAAIRSGKRICLASKEILVLAGKWVMAEARARGVDLLPVDSEHNALFQCLAAEPGRRYRRLILTASGGQFRDWPVEDLVKVTPADAVRHPNWNMGPKVTVDSATMANKGLELIEARWLFDARPDQLAVVIHPQSIVHSMVEFADGSILAQLCPPSMTFPIQHCLFHPDRADSVMPTLDFAQALSLDFRPPDPARYPCLGLALQALSAGGAAPAIFNAANEEAVAAFLAGKAAFTDIPRIVERALSSTSFSDPETLEEMLAADAEARRLARNA